METTPHIDPDPAVRRAHSRDGRLVVWDEQPGRARAAVAEIASHPEQNDPVATKLDTSPPRVVVPIDFSAGSRAALRHAERIARKESARLHLLHVFDVPAAWTQQGSACIEAILDVEQDAKNRLHAFARESDAEADVEFRLGDPVGAITDCATRIGADRIVIGARRRPGPGPIGHVAREVRSESPCRVDLVSEPKRGAA